MMMMVMDVIREPWAHVIVLVAYSRLLAGFYLGYWAPMYAFYVGAKDHMCASIHLCYGWVMCYITKWHGLCIVMFI